MLQTILVQFATQGLALFAAAVTREFAVASLVANAINIFQLYVCPKPPTHRCYQSLTTSLSAGFILVEPPVYAAWIRWLSPYFYSFRIVATVLFKDRTFACPSVSQANLEQCDGNNVLRSFRFNLDTNIGAWFGGLIAFALFEYAFSCLILWVCGSCRLAPSSFVADPPRPGTLAVCATPLRLTRTIAASRRMWQTAT